MWLKLLPVMSLIILLPSSSFFLSSHLTELIKQRDFNQAQLDHAITLKIPAAYQVLQARASYGSTAWLVASQALAKSSPDVAKALGDYYYGQKQVAQAIFWYQQAIRAAFVPAYLSLASVYVEQDKLDQAWQTLTQGNTKGPLADGEQGIARLLLQMEIAITRGDIAFVKQHLARLRHQPAASSLLQAIAHYQILPQQGAALPSVHIAPLQSPLTKSQCRVSISPFATNLNELDAMQALVKQFEQHALASFVCFSKVRYRAINTLKCEYQSGQAIQCRERHWAGQSKALNSRFIALMLPKGGANVHLGILYLDKHDTVQVFAHEIAHLLGFIDEYPLPAQHDKCANEQQEAFSHNIVVLNQLYQGQAAKIRQQLMLQIPWASQIADTTPILQGVEDGWKLGTPVQYRQDVGVFSAETCDKTNQTAFKPLYGQTQLRYFEQPFPALYLSLLKKNPQQYLMPSFHYNIALELFLGGDVSQAKQWLNEAVKWEQGSARKQKIGQGDF